MNVRKHRPVIFVYMDYISEDIQKSGFEFIQKPILKENVESLLVKHQLIWFCSWVKVYVDLQFEESI
jgi:hypothetical protein